MTKKHPAQIKMIVLVEILDENLKKSYGLFKHYEQKKAMIGQQQGLWRIVSEKDTYNDKEMKPDAYLKKTRFKKGLTFRNMYGEDKRK